MVCSRVPRLASPRTHTAAHLPDLPLPLAPPVQLLLDNALSAVDHHTAQHIFKHCVRDMFRDKAVVLVTHQVLSLLRLPCLLCPARRWSG